MEKPTLKDFNLTEQDFIVLEEQKKRLKDAHSKRYEQIKKIEKNNASTFKIAFIPAFIFVIICALSFISCKDEKSQSIGGFFVSLITLIYIIVIIKRGYKNPDIPWPSDNDYIDPDLSHKIHLYNEAIRDYEYNLERQKEQYWIDMDGYKFEEAVATLFENMGYHSIVTPKSGDGGVDIILTKDNKKIAVQCKHHFRPVGPNDYRALIGSLVTGQYNGGIFVSLSGFTSGVITENNQSRVRLTLLQLDDLIRISNGLAEHKFPTKKTRFSNSQPNNDKVSAVYTKKFQQPDDSIVTTSKNLIGAIAQIEVNGIGTKNGEIIKITDGMEGKIATIKININGKSEYRNYMLSAIKDRIIKYGSTGNL